MGHQYDAQLARVGIVASEPLQRAGLLALLEGSTHLSAVTILGEHLLEDESITHLLVDIAGNKQPLALIESFNKHRSDLRYILIGGPSDERLMTAALYLGVRGYLPQEATPGQIVSVVEEVIGGSMWMPRRVVAAFLEHVLHDLNGPKKHKSKKLTERERQVLRLLATACSSREIAEQLGIQPRTVKAYIASLMEKTNSDSRLSLTMYAVAHAETIPVS